MILEVAILNFRPGKSADFERAFADAQAIIASMPGYAPTIPHLSASCHPRNSGYNLARYALRHHPLT